MIDNFDHIKPLLPFGSEDDFYFCQILKRKKEHPELGSNSYVVKTYFIKSVEELEEQKGEMICLATYHNARVCINLNRRSFERVAFEALLKTTNQIMNKDFKSVRKAYNSVCGGHHNDPVKKWIIDVDVSYQNGGYDYALSILKKLDNIAPTGSKRVALLPTKNGWHLITTPFDVREANLTEEIHKDNPTILYIP